ncbi:Di-copper centre-containing protein, partial [Dissoconium aciculare CBS 342.82]|uniref:tyrosinase n=1 Tax=Dissoconium aciculare CBS 342.82 TaxID=1314786 RepID=A0A6J3MIN3_9PEZI
VYPRLEINELQKNKDQFNLFILALQAWQDESQDRHTSSSYYGVSKIHGVPFGPFNGDPEDLDNTNQHGYCTHNSILFPTWHRVYLAMYEQQLLARAFLIANKFTGDKKTAMLTAATQLRIPYWDWAAVPANGNSLPDISTYTKVNVTSPDFGPISIDNPLYSFKFKHAKTDSTYGIFNDWNSTLRYPNNNLPGASTRDKNLNAAFTVLDDQHGLQDQVYHLLTKCKDYGMFATGDAVFSNEGYRSSLEVIHNTVHMRSGGDAWKDASGNWVVGGHMTYLPLASYDPLFWLHHANVDRIFALWQAMNPTLTFNASQKAVDNTYTIKINDPIDNTTNLTPFLKGDGQYWQPKDVADYKATFSYTYPEFLTGLTPIQQINALYSSSRGPVVTERSLGSYAPAGKAAAPSAIDNAKLAANGSEYQYSADIQTPRFALQSSYTVYIFLGEPASEDPSTWSFDDNQVGPFGVLAGVPGSNMVMEEVIISGSIPLTRKLQRKLESGELKSMAPTDVNPYLKANLKWKISWLGSCVDPTTLKGFIVSVAASTATLPADDTEAPVYSPSHIIVDVTAGVAGGLN